MESIQLKCQLCGHPHTYEMKIERNPIMRGSYDTTMDSAKKAQQFTHLFTCPDKGQMFEATITLKPRGSRIKNVKITGFVK